MLFLLLVYCCGIGVAGRQLHTSSVAHFSEGTYISAAKNSMFCHIPQDENLYAKVNEAQGSEPASPLGEFLALQAHNKLFLAVVRQYHGDWVNFLIRHRKANLLFPFHSFW